MNNIKRIICVFLFILVFVANWRITSFAEEIKYYRENAVKYARLHCDTNAYNDNNYRCFNGARVKCENYTPPPDRPSKVDCANFVSQALIDGGLSFNDLWGVETIGKKNSGKAGTKGNTGVRHLLPNIEENFCFEFTTDHTKAKPGDVLSLKGESHVVLYTGDNSYCGHTTDRCDYNPLYDDTNPEDIWNLYDIYHFKDDDLCRKCVRDTNPLSYGDLGKYLYTTSYLVDKCDGCSNCVPDTGECRSKCSAGSDRCAPSNRCVTVAGVMFCQSFGPGGDCPDDTFTLGSATPLISEAIYPSGTAPVGVLNNGYAHDMLRLLSTFGREARLVEVDGVNPDLVAGMPLLIIPSGGLIGFSGSESLKASLGEYAGRGGTVIAFAQQRGADLAVLPGGVAGYGWQEDQSCQANSSYIDEWHPMLSGQTRSTPSVNIDGYFSNYPDNTTVILRRTANGQPALVTYPVGQGRVIAAAAYPDYAYTSVQAHSDEIRLVRDMVSHPNITQEETS